MNDQQLLRYSRHILLPEIGIDGQQRLAESRVLVVGAGGLGSPASLYLAASGVGTLTVADGDEVDLTNLQRQLAFRMAHLGDNKAAATAQTIAGITGDVHTVVVPRHLGEDDLHHAVASADVVLDCTDNFATRHSINRACVAHRRPLVSGAAIGFDGQVAVFDQRVAGAPCYHCLFPESARADATACAVMGVFAPIAGIIGATQAAEALKLIVGISPLSSGRLMMLDGRRMEWHGVQIARSRKCRLCERAGEGAAAYA